MVWFGDCSRALEKNTYFAVRIVYKHQLDPFGYGVTLFCFLVDYILTCLLITESDVLKTPAAISLFITITFPRVF